MMDTYIIDAWMRRDDKEDDDAYEGRMNLGPPNNVAAAVEHENQRLADNESMVQTRYNPDWNECS